MTTLEHLYTREFHNTIVFDAALELYAMGVDPEYLIHAASLVMGSSLPLDPDHAAGIANLTGAIVKLKTYDDAGRAVQRWGAAMDELGMLGQGPSPLRT
jgi:hypothetical protein